MSHHHAEKPDRPKKDGAGGKGNWGKEGEEFGAPDVVDPHDPNYDSGDDKTPATPAMVVFKAGTANILDEYFASGDAGDVARVLKELGHPELHHEFVKAVISRSLDLKDRERELASELLPHLYPNPISHNKVVEGFTILLERLDDLKLDIPKAPEFLSMFLARAVVDDLLPPSFLSPDSADVEIAKETLIKAKSLLSGKFAAKRIAHIWGASGDQSVKRIKERTISILDEYYIAHDIIETEKALRDLAAPSFHYYFVKKAILKALDSNDNGRDKLVKLLSNFTKSGLISEGQVATGFKACVDTMNDIELDTPNGKQLLGVFVEKSVAAGYLPATFTEVYKDGLAKAGNRPK